MGLLDNIKGFFKEDEESYFPAVIENKTTEDFKDGVSYENPFKQEETKPDLYSEVLFMNDSVSTVAEACSCCWDKTVPDNYKDKIEYIGRRCKTGHTSILEHSNLIIGVYVKAIYIESLIEVLASNRYLHTIVKDSYEHLNAKYLIIGGSWRGFIDLFYNSTYLDNPLLLNIKTRIYESVPKEIMYSLIKDGVMDENRFVSNPVCPPDVKKITISRNVLECTRIEDNLDPIESDRTIDFGMYMKKINTSDYKKYGRFIDPINIDNIGTINFIINNFIQEDSRPVDDYVSVYELGDLATITLCFKDMSRTATHQLVRHRNAITQESQRYVDYSNHGFINPLDYSAEKYKQSDPTKATYNFNGEILTLNQLSDKLMSYYQVLVNDKNAPLHKEDARSYLPSNVACAKLYMTFTYRTFAKFLELRDHIAAQSEIRAFAHSCKIWFDGIWDEESGLELNNFNLSKYSIALAKANYMENIKED